MLLTTYGADNRVIISHKLTWSEHRTIYGEWWEGTVFAPTRKLYTAAYRITRHCIGTYQYVGMNYETALACKDAMIDMYTRTTQYTKWNDEDGKFHQADGGQMLMAAVSMFKQGPNMWGVRIDINEHESLDGMPGKNNYPDFGFANSRSYEI